MIQSGSHIRIRENLETSEPSQKVIARIEQGGSLVICLFERQFSSILTLELDSISVGLVVINYY
jgi:hypothetical protein